MHERQDNLAQRMLKAMRATQAQRLVRLDNAAQYLALLNPQHVLARGYSLVQDASGGVLQDASGLAIGTELRITFAQGWARTEVKETGV